MMHINAEYEALKTGIEKEVAIPLFNAILTHLPQIETAFKSFADEMKTDIPIAINQAIQAFDEIKPQLEEMKGLFHYMTDSQPGNRESDTMKQQIRDNYGSFMGDIFIGATSHEEVGGLRLIEDIGLQQLYEQYKKYL
jgi:hypothetical protein